VAVEEPKERKHFRCSHLLAPADFRGRRVSRPNAQSHDPGPEIWLLRQRSVTTVDACRTGSECPMMSVPALVYIVGGIREILTSVAPLELRQL